MKSKTLSWLLIFARPYRAQLGLGLALAVLTSVLTLIIPSLVGQLTDGLGSFAAHPNANGTDSGTGIPASVAYGLLFIGLLAGRTVCGFLSSYALGTAAARTVTDLRQGFLTRFLTAPIAFHDQQPSAGLIAALTADAGFIEQSLNTALPAIAQHVPVILVGTVLALLTNPALMITLIVISAPFILIVARVGQHVREIAQRGQDVLAQAAIAGQEGLLGLRLIKSLGRETWASQRFGSLLNVLLYLKRQRVLWVALLEAALPMGAILGVLGVAWVVRQQLADQSMSRAGFVTFASYLAIMAASVRQLISAYTGLESMLGAADRLTDLAERVGEPEALAGTQLSSHHDTAALPAGGAIVFHKVSFTFGGDNRRVSEIPRGVQHLSFSIAAGEVVSITGHNGAGKSTIAQLMLRFYPPDQGSITLNGFRADDVALADWRHHFALVTRDPVLFGVSIFENIQLGRLGATETDVTKAAEAVGLHTFISSLPHGYHTQVGEAGIQLSAGQRQRIALARVFLQDPAVVILDEATHSLDAESEAIFWAALLAWQRKRTLIVISHQPITGLPVTRIIHMAHGQIVSNDLLTAGTLPLPLMS